MFGGTADDVVNEAFRIIVPENPLYRVRGTSIDAKRILVAPLHPPMSFLQTE